MVDEAAGILVSEGALGCEVSKISRRAAQLAQRSPSGMPEKFPQPIAPSVSLQAYFNLMTPALLKRLQARLRAAKMLTDGSTPEISKITDPGWATMWQARFAPIRVGARFLIVPPWLREREPGRLQIVIRPGQAFGTGHHASTSDTLTTLEELCAAHHVSRALDVGTGSGILAIAMAKLGIAEITAIDNDPVALANARENAKLNRVLNKIQFSTIPAGSLRRRFSLIAANILSSTLVRMAPELKPRLRRRGHLILAGILRREAASVVAAYLPDLRYVGARNHGAWTTLILTR